MGDTRLERLADRHLEAVAELVADPDVLRFTRIPVPTPPDFARSWLASYERGRLDGTREGFAIVDAAGAVLGLALAPHIEREEATVELGYVVAPAARGRGVATAALRLLTDWALGELGARRVELRIGVANEASKRVAERCGYTREGVLRSLYLKPGVREDTEIWSRLPDDG
ncbi:MAG TPA: GNAT family N-acetyltransferase [Gaiellaceae bacterium]|nr:GNAT family N-acetyltransferase [Gaiellaceae bacterium]